jgi:chondroitin synthase
MIVSARDLPLPKMLGAGNDYTFMEERLAASGLVQSIDNFVPTKSLSIVIPVLDRPDLLRLGLESLKRQKNQRSDLEIIVVDDGSGLEVKSVCDESGIHALKYLRRDPDPRFTESAARNEGIRAARNEIILQLDPEVIFPSELAINWIMRWFELDVDAAVTVPRLYIRSNGVKLADVRSGDVPIWETGESDLREPLFEDPTLLKHRYLPFLEMLGFCLAYRRDSAMAAGGWAEDWTEYGGADQEFSYRLYQRGAFCVYERNAVALHLQHPVSTRTGTYKAFLAERVPAYRAHRYEGAPLIGRAKVPRVSIFIPAHNIGRYIDDALASARKQTYEDIEICVCDDGSTDDTPDKINEHAKDDRRVRWIQTRHEGCAAASNSAVNIARGEFLLQLDGDDVLATGAVKRMLAELDRYPWVGLVFGNLLRTDDQLRPIGPGHVFKSYRRFQMLMCMPITAPRMWRYRLHALVGGWNTNLSSAIDYDLFLRMAERTHFRHIDEILYYYRQREGSLSTERELQFSNAQKALEDSMSRMGLSEQFQIMPSSPGNARWYEFVKSGAAGSQASGPSRI